MPDGAHYYELLCTTRTLQNKIIEWNGIRTTDFKNFKIELYVRTSTALLHCLFLSQVLTSYLHIPPTQAFNKLPLKSAILASVYVSVIVDYVCRSEYI